MVIYSFFSSLRYLPTWVQCSLKPASKYQQRELQKKPLIWPQKVQTKYVNFPHLFFFFLLFHTLVPMQYSGSGGSGSPWKPPEWGGCGGTLPLCGTTIPRRWDKTISALSLSLSVLPEVGARHGHSHRNAWQGRINSSPSFLAEGAKGDTQGANISRLQKGRRSRNWSHEVTYKLLRIPPSCICMGVLLISVPKNSRTGHTSHCPHLSPIPACHTHDLTRAAKALNLNWHWNDSPQKKGWNL